MGASFGAAATAADAGGRMTGEKTCPYCCCCCCTRVTSMYICWIARTRYGTVVASPESVDINLSNARKTKSD